MHLTIKNHFVCKNVDELSIEIPASRSDKSDLILHWGFKVIAYYEKCSFILS